VSECPAQSRAAEVCCRHQPDLGLSEGSINDLLLDQDERGACRALAGAAVRQPFGPPDPVLCGGAAVRLYTGDLWSAGCLEVFTAAPQPLIAELFAAGFRWTGRPRLADRGLWHPELQIGIDVIDHVQRGLAQPSNTLTVALDLGATGPADRELVSLKVVGIEDLIVSEVARPLA